MWGVKEDLAKGRARRMSGVGVAVLCGRWSRGRSSQTEASLSVWEVLRGPGQLMLKSKAGSWPLSPVVYSLGSGEVVGWSWAPEC